MPKTIILIPSRLAATRLPNKPLLKINNKSIISLVFEKAKSARLGKVYVATGDQKIFDNVKENGGNCILTKLEHKTGTDRIFEALKKLNQNDIDYVINLQGDEPMINVQDLINLNNHAIYNKSNMATLACKIENDDIFKKNSIVKVITHEKISKTKSSKAKQFLRVVDKSNKNFIYHHMGVYIYKVSTLQKFVTLNQTEEEKSKNLEQISAMENDIEIDVIYAMSSPIVLDTKEDYIEIKKLMEYKL